MDQRATFILRLWREPDKQPGVWRGQVENVATTARRTFADLPAFFAYIESELARLENESVPQASVIPISDKNLLK